MPYKNIVFVKLLWKQLLLDDQRFCNLADDQKGLYLMLLLLAGATNNNIPSDENYLKRTLNLSQSPEIIAKNRDCLLAVFPKLIGNNGSLKFKNFKDLHNYVPKSQFGVDLSVSGRPREDKNKIRIDKETRKRIRCAFIKLKGWNGISLDTSFFGETDRHISEIWQMCQDPDLIIRGLEWVANKDYIDWNIRTLWKKFPDFKASLNKKEVSRYKEL